MWNPTQPNVDAMNAIISAEPILLAKYGTVTLGTYDATATQIYAENNTLNEFLNALVNKVVVQRVFDPLKWKNPFTVFVTNGGELGDAMELLATTLPATEEYSESMNPFEVKKATPKNIWIKTTDRKVWRVSVTKQILAGAFSQPNGLVDFINGMITKLRKKRDLYLYQEVKKDLVNVGKTVEITEITGVGESSNALKAYEEIMKVALDMTMPSKKYNEKELESATPLGEQVLILNARYKSSFDINVLASLFNNDKIDPSKYFKEVLVVDIDLDEDGEAIVDPPLGYILDVERYVIANRIEETTNIFNPANLIWTYFFHNWIKRGHNTTVQGVKLIKPAV